MTPEREAFAARLRRCVDPVRPLAKELGVGFIQLATTKDFPANVRRFSESDSSKSGRFGLDITTRTVYVVRGAIFRDRLHELGHAVCDAPGYELDMIEHGLLLQWERAVAKEIFSKRAYEELVFRQEENEVWWSNNGMLHGVEGYESDDFWLLGYEFARRLDLLDADNRPTFRRANWDRLRPREKAAMIAKINEDKLL